MFTRFAFVVYLIIVVTHLSFSDDRQHQFCIAPDTSLLASTIFHWCTPVGQNEYSYGWVYSYNEENRILTRCYSYEDTHWSHSAFELYAYSNGGLYLDKNTVFKQSTAEYWEYRSRLTERRHDDIDTVTEDYTSIAFRNIYIKNNIGQVVERIYLTGAYDVWNEHFRQSFEYDCRGNKIYETFENTSGNPYEKLYYEYNSNNQLVNFRNQIFENGNWVDRQKEFYIYDSRKRLVLYVNLAMVNNVLDSAQKREIIYSNSKCNPITRTYEYEYMTNGLRLVEQRIDYSNHAGLVTETQGYYYGSDSTISRSKLKYEYDHFRNLLLTTYFHLDSNGVWMKDYFETKSYLYVNSSDNQNYNSCKREWDGLPDIERFYSNPFNYDRQVLILDSNGKLRQVKKLILGTTGQNLDSLKEITPEQLINLRKSKEQRVFWRGNIAILMNTHNYR